ncbi:hypothetical protein [Leptospira idonii]|uniref:hypothetical protein n=1 Tax=Leptospira idonii TaxID=1193500 RepID=UPI0014386CBB|nr:hypothetical protein [Leptospira idonii]
MEKHPGFFARSRFSSDIKKEINARQIKINLGIGFFNILLCLGIMWVYGIGLMH